MFPHPLSPQPPPTSTTTKKYDKIQKDEIWGPFALCDDVQSLILGQHGTWCRLLPRPKCNIIQH